MHRNLGYKSLRVNEDAVFLIVPVIVYCKPVYL